MNGYVFAIVTPLLACGLLLVASILVGADLYRPARRVLGPLLLLACLSLFAGIGSIVAMALP